MTDQQKTQVKRLREEGVGYSRIASLLALSDNTVKAYCRRNGLGGKVGIEQRNKEPENICKNCGLPVMQYPGRKEKKFCSDACRMKWWKDRPELVNRKAVYEFDCPQCKKHFTAYGNAHRKYCSHKCYIAARFGGGKDE